MSSDKNDMDSVIASLKRHKGAVSVRHVAKVRSVEALAGQFAGPIATIMSGRAAVEEAFRLAEAFVEEADRRLRAAHEKDEQEQSGD